MPVELEVRFSGLPNQDSGIAGARNGFQEILQALDTSDTSTITLVIDDLNSSSALLTVFCREVQNFPLLRILVVRLSPTLAPEIPLALLELQQICQQQACAFRTDVMLDEYSDGFAAFAGKADEHGNVLRLSQQLMQSGVTVRWLVPAIQPLIFRLEGIVSLAREQDIEPLIIAPEIVTVSGAQIGDLSSDERLFLWDFITYRILKSDLHLLKPGQRGYYLSLVNYVEQQGCGLEPAVVSVLSVSESLDWRLTSESISGAEMRSIALVAMDNKADQDGPVQRAIGLVNEVAEVLIDGGRGHILRALVGANRNGVKDVLDARVFKKVLLIGAYGGEHIGDVAILGGVLHRIHARYGTSEAVLMTQRLAHTEHLMPMLDVPVDVTIDVYERPQIQSQVADVDCVVFAGGPLIDLPKQLVRHLYTVSLARKLGKPFVVEGIGPGPFVRLPSKFTARRLMEMASGISLRAKDAVNHDAVRGLDTEVGRCPAFNYLESRGAELSRLPDVDIASIRVLLEGSEGRPVIGVNIRPISHFYTTGAANSDVAAYTRNIERRFEQRFAEGLRDYCRKSDEVPCFIFFPMNAIQFGLSDLASAFRIQRILGSEVDFRVWQADVSIDGVIALLRELDVAITMRFHATIFALTQNCKVIGIDYRIGQRDKIAGLMEDVGQGEHCTRIDLLTKGWLANKLEELAKI